MITPAFYFCATLLIIACISCANQDKTRANIRAVTVTRYEQVT